MSDLERSLYELGRAIEFPPSPDLGLTVERRLAAEGRPRGRRRTWRVLVVAFAVFLFAVGTAFAVPQSRDFILERLGLRGATVERVIVLPEVPPAVAGEVFLGDPVTLAEAQQRVDFEILVPELLGPPDKVYVDASAPGGRASLVYVHNQKVPTTTEAGIGLLVTEFRGDLAPELLGKLVEGGTAVERMSVGGAPGLWISGPPHVIFYRDAGGEVRDETLRLAGSALLWERGSLLLRIESELSREKALEIARSFEPGPGD